MKKPRILVVDDETAFRSTIYEYITTVLKYECDVAINGLHGLRKVFEGNFDVIILDYPMPVMNGRALLKILYKYKPEIPVIVSTSRPIYRGGHQMYFDYLAKPFPLKQLTEYISRALESKKKQGKQTSLLVKLQKENQFLLEELTKAKNRDVNDFSEYHQLIWPIIHDLKNFQILTEKLIGSVEKEDLSAELSDKFEKLKTLLSINELATSQLSSLSNYKDQEITKFNIIEELRKISQKLGLDTLVTNSYVNTDLETQRVIISGDLDCFIETNVERFHLIFRNLFYNSMESLNDDGLIIEIKVEKKDSEIKIEYIDNCAGMLPDKLEQLFLFDNDKSGLGMYLIYQSILKLKGAVSVKSYEGEGSIFLITLPVT